MLFLFVVMMLDVDFAELRQGFLQYLPIGAVVGGILLIELVLVLFGPGRSARRAAGDRGADPADRQMLNTEALGHVLYTRYVYFFQAAGLVLLVAMIGAIVLTLRTSPTSNGRTSPSRSRAPRRPRSRSSRSGRGQGAWTT